MGEEERYTRQQSEKNEKDEKDQGGGWDEKWRRDPIDAAMWAFILIWAGLVLLGANLGWFDDMGFEPVGIGFIGAGVIVLFAVLVRLLVPAYRKPLGGSLILAVVFIGIGIGIATNQWVVIVPLVLIAIGVAALLFGLFRGRGSRE
jgi:hypothetical protein